MHEQAVAHVMTIVLPVALAVAERQGRAGVPVTGRQLIEAVVLGVDVAASLGVAATSGLRFFRPATVGAFGGAAVLGKLLGFDATRLHDAFSIVYGQLCGTMQAHTEGSLLLAMQMGFNARNAIVAGDLAAAGVAGPRNILEGDFGYYKLIETAGDPGRAAAELGRIWRITEVAQKPFPSGRATHGLIDGCLDLQRRHGFSADQISRVTAHVPPLVHQLVGRPCRPDMSINYARLCASYVAACALLRGTVGIEDFCDTAYRDPATQALAARIEVKVAAGNPNALTPVAVEIELQGGARHAITLDVVTGHPRRPMTRTAHLAKFETNCAHAAVPLPPEKVQHLIALVDTLEAVADAATLVDAMIA